MGGFAAWVGRVVRVAVALVVGGLALAMPAGAAAAPGHLSAKAHRQIAALQELKRSLTPAERKLGGRLAVAVRQRGYGALRLRAARVRTGVVIGRRGATEVDVRAARVDASLLARLRALGAVVRAASAAGGSVRVALPLRALGEVAAWRQVRRIDAAVAGVSADVRAGVVSESKRAWALRLDGELRAALAAGPSGPVVSEGDRAQASDAARARFGVTGVGVKVCVLSDGVDSLAAEQAAGELPAVDVLAGQAGERGDEGTAMLEIVHDVAPGAELGFATAFASVEAFAENIRALRRAGCDVLVDDILYVNEDPFQDGPIARAVEDVVAGGALYFSAAGNYGNTLDGTAANFEGDFVAAGRAVGKFAGAAHDFDPGPGVQVFQPLSDASGAGTPVTLFWADPLGAASDDYDLYLFDGDDDLVGFSQDVQDGDDDPYEFLRTGLSGRGLRLAVVKFSGAARPLQLSALRARFEDSADGLVARVTPGVLRGHAAAQGAFAVGAAPAADPLPFELEPGDPANPAGPFPGAFTAAQAPERFTSDGPRRVFFAPDGTPLTPEDRTWTGGKVRAKPDVTAADGVSTGIGDFAPFFGTSASAAHAAGLAALVASSNPGTTTAELRDAFRDAALDLAPAGFDARSGLGLLRADEVLAVTGATPQPLVRAGQPTVRPDSGDGDAFLEPGERATLTLPVTNAGDGLASGVSVRVATGDPSATLTPHAQGYGDLPRGATQSRSFTLALAGDYPLGKPVPLVVRVSFAGVLSPTSSTFDLPTGQPAANATTFSYSGPPVAIPDDSADGASVTLPVAGVGYAAQLTFSIDGDACTSAAGATTVGVDHTFLRDLVGTLTAPSGRSATLFSHSGGYGHNLCQVVFDDDADTPFAQALAEDAPYTGRWRPDQPLHGLLAGPVDGDWRFTVTDTANADTGSIRAVSLHIRGFTTR